MSLTLLEQPLAISLKSHQALSLCLESRVLRDNPLGDSPLRQHLILQPKRGRKWPVVVHLPGYFGTGVQSFAFKPLQRSFAEEIDWRATQGKINPLLHVFVDSMTTWGGSQYINSPGCGRHQDHILMELVPALQKAFPTTGSLILAGGSSGGYGALQLLSLKDSPFTQAYAVAPDSFFEASLLPELRRMLPAFAEYGYQLKRVKQDLDSGELAQSKHFFHLVHGIAMAHCYAPQSSLGPHRLELPLDLQTGMVKKDLWRKWCEWDPIHFLPKRLNHLKGKRLVLEVGTHDEYSAQFGSRQIRDLLKGSRVKLGYREFIGNHFGLSERKLAFLESL